MGDKYYVIFQKDGKVYILDESGIKDVEKINFAFQIEDGPISLCKYKKDNIQCDLYSFVKKMK